MWRNKFDFPIHKQVSLSEEHKQLVWEGTAIYGIHKFPLRPGEKSLQNTDRVMLFPLSRVKLNVVPAKENVFTKETDLY